MTLHERCDEILAGIDATLRDEPGLPARAGSAWHARVKPMITSDPHERTADDDLYDRLDRTFR